MIIKRETSGVARRPLWLIAVALAVAVVVLLMLRTGPVDAGADIAEEGDAGDLPVTAQVPVWSGPLGSISGEINSTLDVDMYQLCLEGGGTFSAETIDVSGLSDTQLFLFDTDGLGVYADDDGGAGFLSLLPEGDPLTPTSPGIYYLAVAAFNRDPVSDSGRIFPTTVGTGKDGPTGPGGGSPINGWINEPGSAGLYFINLTGVTIDSEFCAQPDPNIVKDQTLANLWLCDTGAPTCTNSESGVEEVDFDIGLDRPVSSLDPKCTGFPNFLPPEECETQAIGSFEFEVRYDSKYVTVDVETGEYFDSSSRPEGEVDCVTSRTEGSVRFACVTKGKPETVPEAVEDLASVVVRPTADVYKLLIPNQENGIVTEVINQDCQLSDLQGHPITTGVCENAAITIRYLEGDVHSDCVIDALDQQQIAFRWGAQLGNLLYNARYDLEPSFPGADGDIDAKDLQFVYGRHTGDPTSTCKAPHPPQRPIDPQQKLSLEPTATPTPAPEPAKPAVMSLKVKSGGTCDVPDKPTECSVPLAGLFTLAVSVNSLPAGDYQSFFTQVVLDNPSVVLGSTTVVWPDAQVVGTDCPGAAGDGGGPAAAFSLAGICAFAQSPGPSGYTGNIVEIQVVCLEPKSIEVALPAWDEVEGFGSFFTLADGTNVPANTVGQQDVEVIVGAGPQTVDVADTLVINCGGTG